jgi:hypothetical protein
MSRDRHTIVVDARRSGKKRQRGTQPVYTIFSIEFVLSLNNDHASGLRHELLENNRIQYYKR